MTESQKRLREAAEAAAPAYERFKKRGRIAGDDHRLHVYGELANPSAILEILAALERAEADAARYRWLKKGAWLGSGAYFFDSIEVDDEGASLDAAIDAARKD